MPLFRHRHQPTAEPSRDTELEPVSLTPEPEREPVHPFAIPDQPEGPYREVKQ